MKTLRAALLTIGMIAASSAFGADIFRADLDRTFVEDATLFLTNDAKEECGDRMYRAHVVRHKKPDLEGCWSFDITNRHVILMDLPSRRVQSIPYSTFTQVIP